MAAAAPWPDVAREARFEKGGVLDAAVVVAVERHATLPGLPGVRVSGQDWARFFPNVLGVPAKRVTTLFDAAATPSAIASALRAAVTQVAPGGRLWFVAVGYFDANPTELISALAPSKAQLVSVLDVWPDDASKLARLALFSTDPARLPSIAFSTASTTPLPGASRPALSYLLMGALRGWADQDHDGNVTAFEAAAYVNLTLRLLSPTSSLQAGPSVSVSDALVCVDLTTLSIAREPAPNVPEIVPSAEPAPSPEASGVVRSPDDPNQQARQLYSRAEGEVDETRARCAWSAAAEAYARSWSDDSEHAWQVEPALNGAYALRKVGRNDEAAALYRAYVKKLGGARAGEGERSARERRAYSFAACSSYLALAKSEPWHFPGYFDTCRGVTCTEDRAACAGILKSADVAVIGSVSDETERARRQTELARDREELAGWERTETARAARLREASEQYAAAEAAWAALIDRGNAANPAEAARHLAEAAVRRIRIELAAKSEVTEQRVENARQLARRARELSSDGRRAEPARLLVELADGLLPRDEGSIVKGELPPSVAAAIAARDEYLASVPATFDAPRLRHRMAYEAGRLLYLYGHFAEARQRLELPYAQCGVDSVAHDAWVLLLSMANVEGDVTRASALASDTAVCPSDVEARIVADRMRRPVRSIPFVLEARRQLEASQALPNGPERSALRREAAAIFRHFASESPDRDEGPESAQRAAELYAELGDPARALEMYRVFVDRYAAHDRVRALDLQMAYTELARLHTELGDYRAAARALTEQSEQKRLPAAARAAAARKARQLRKARDGRP